MAAGSTASISALTLVLCDVTSLEKTRHQTFLNELPEDEVSRINQFYFTADAQVSSTWRKHCRATFQPPGPWLQRSACGQYLQRWLCAALEGKKEISDVSLPRSRLRRPTWSHTDAGGVLWDSNVTHDGSIVACAAAPGSIGVDVTSLVFPPSASTLSRACLLSHHLQGHSFLCRSC